jgi:hypothetical protein
MGILPGLKAFIAAVLGGIGNVAGAVVGGLLLGLLEVMIVAFFPAWAGYRDAAAFILLIAFCQPTGLLGELGEKEFLRADGTAALPSAQLPYYTLSARSLGQSDFHGYTENTPCRIGEEEELSVCPAPSPQILGSYTILVIGI